MTPHPASNGHDPQAEEILRLLKDKTDTDDSLVAEVERIISGGGANKKGSGMLIKAIAGLALTIMGSSAAGVYSLVSQADDIARLPEAVHKITTVLAGEQDEWGKRSPGLIERFEQQGEAMTDAVQTLTISLETLSGRMDAIERSTKRVEANTVHGPPEKP
jgi:hypothetical protein